MQFRAGDSKAQVLGEPSLERPESDQDGGRWLIAAVLLVASAVRMWGLGMDLPYVYHPDEPNNLALTLAMLQNGDLNPHWFQYPSMMFYVYGAVLWAVSSVATLFGGIAGIAEVAAPRMIAMGSGLTSEVWTFYVPRLVSVALSVTIVWVVYSVVKRVTGSRWAAAGAGLLIALAPTAVTQGRVFTPNTIAGLFSALGVWASFEILRRGDKRTYVIAGAMVGLAAGSKYNAALIALTVIMAHLMRAPRPKSILDSNLLAAGYVSLGVFLLTTPFGILDSATFLSDLGFVLNVYSSGLYGAVGGLPVYVGGVFISFSVSLALVPFAWRVPEIRRESLIAFIFAVAYVLYLATYEVTFVRNLLPALPALAIAIGIGAHGASVHTGSRGLTLPTTAIVAAVLASSLFAGSAVWSNYQSAPDRMEAVEWIAREIPEGASVLVESYSPWIEPASVDLVSTFFVAEHPGPSHWEYVVITENGSGRFMRHPDLYPRMVASLEKLRATTCLLQSFPGVAEIRAADCQSAGAS